MDPRLSIERHKHDFVCPSCGAALLVHMGVRLEAAAVREAALTAQARLDEESQQIIDAAKAAGLLEPFTVVVQKTMAQQLPQNMERFFVTFLRTATPRRIPRFALDHFNRLFNRRPLAYWGAQQLGMVVVDGNVRLFVPNELLRGTAVRRLTQGNPSAGGGRRLDIAAAPERLEAWIRTRWGYVSEDGALLTTLRAKSFGEFALPGL